MDAADLKELFAPFGEVAIKRLFGGYGIYADGLCFAIEHDGDVYLKCDPETEPAFEAAGLARFQYRMQGKPKSMAYRRLITEAYDEPEVLRRWARMGWEAARRAASGKGKKTGKASSVSRGMVGA